MKAWLALGVIAIMMASAIPAGAASWQEARQEYASARENFQLAYADWLSAKAKYIQDRATWWGQRNATNFETMCESARIAGEKAADMFVAYLKMLEMRANMTWGLPEENKNSLTQELETYIAEIENLKLPIQTATIGTGALKETIRDLGEYWLSIRVRVKQIAAELIVAGFRAMVERAEAFAARIEVKVQELKENGVDTSDLESWLDNFNYHLELADEKVENAEAKVAEMTDNVTFGQIYASALSHLKNALTYLKLAFGELKEIVISMRSQGHSIELRGSGTVVARGSGSLSAEGSGLVKVMAAENSVMIVSPNAHVEAIGTGTVENLENGDIQYSGFGSAKVTGSEIRVWISGKNLRIRASGTGTVTLTGTGSYWTYGESQSHTDSWKAEGTTVEISTGEILGVS